MNRYMFVFKDVKLCESTVRQPRSGCVKEVRQTKPRALLKVSGGAEGGGSNL